MEHIRITVDGTSHPIHDNATGASIVLSVDDRVCEVQVVRNGDHLVVIMAGNVESFVDQRGNQGAAVIPVVK